jgi:hypothetical protein
VETETVCLYSGGKVLTQIIAAIVASMLLLMVIGMSFGESIFLTVVWLLPAALAETTVHVLRSLLASRVDLRWLVEKSLRGALARSPFFAVFFLVYFSLCRFLLYVPLGRLLGVF